MSVTYGWIITRDYITPADEREGTHSVGTMGPRNIPADLVKRLHAGEGTAFRLLDDDGEVYYHGRLITTDPGGEDEFGPLNDFGTPNAGAVDIQYRDPAGKWQSL